MKDSYMVGYLVIAKAEILSEKSNRILSKYAKFTNTVLQIAKYHSL